MSTTRPALHRCGSASASRIGAIALALGLPLAGCGALDRVVSVTIDGTRPAGTTNVFVEVSIQDSVLKQGETAIRLGPIEPGFNLVLPDKGKLLDGSMEGNLKCLVTARRGSDECLASGSFIIPISDRTQFPVFLALPLIPQQSPFTCPTLLP